MSGVFSAVILAGGRSSRMGTEKALLPTADGRRLWERQRDVLKDAGAAEIFISARPDQIWARNAAGISAVVHDAEPDCGPLAGICAALGRARESHLAVLAVDLPEMTPEWFEALKARCVAGCGVVGRRGSFFEPLAAIYPREIFPRVQAAFAKKELSLQTMLTGAMRDGSMRERAIAAEEMTWFRNWNDSRVSENR